MLEQSPNLHTVQDNQSTNVFSAKIILSTDLPKFCVIRYIHSYVSAYCHGQCLFSASGANSTLQPPPAVNIVFEEKTEDTRIMGLFTVNISWTHPIGMYIRTCMYVCVRYLSFNNGQYA